MTNLSVHQRRQSRRESKENATMAIKGLRMNVRMKKQFTNRESQSRFESRGSGGLSQKSISSIIVRL